MVFYMNERDIQQALIDIASDHADDGRHTDEDIARWEAPDEEPEADEEPDADPDWGW